MHAKKPELPDLLSWAHNNCVEWMKTEKPSSHPYIAVDVNDIEDIKVISRGKTLFDCLISAYNTHGSQ
jgi:hypothetical protein